MDIEYKMLPPSKEEFNAQNFKVQKKRVSLYLALTVSISLFLITFSLAETARTEIRSLTESRIEGLGEIIGEKLLFSFLGIKDSRSHLPSNKTEDTKNSHG